MYETLQLLFHMEKALTRVVKEKQKKPQQQRAKRNKKQANYKEVQSNFTIVCKVKHGYVVFHVVLNR